MAGLERGYVSRLERSQYYTSIATLQKLAVALDVDLSELTELILVTRDKRSNPVDKGACSDQELLPDATTLNQFAARGAAEDAVCWCHGVAVGNGFNRDVEVEGQG